MGGRREGREMVIIMDSVVPDSDVPHGRLNNNHKDEWHCTGVGLV